MLKFYSVKWHMYNGLVLKMANQVEIEEIFSEHFENHPELRISYFIMNSLFDRNLFEFLDCRQLAKTFWTTNRKVINAAKHLQKCCPDVVICASNLNYRNTVITKLGKDFLVYDISKVVPQDGISSEELKKRINATFLKKCVRENWLIFEQSADKYLPGKNFSDYVRLYTALNKYKQTKDLTNQQHLVAQRYIKTIKGRHEISRGSLFPSDVNEKLFRLYVLAEAVYNEMLEDLQASSDQIKQKKSCLRMGQQNVCNKIKSHNERRRFLKDPQEKLMIIQSQMNSWRQNYAVPEQSARPQSPPDIIPLPKQVPSQPQNQPLPQLPNQQMQHRPLPQENKWLSQKRDVTEQPHYFGKLPRIEPQREYNPSLQSTSQLSQSLEEQHSSTHRQHVTQQAHYSGQPSQMKPQGEYNPWLQSTSQLTQSLEEQRLPTHQQEVMEQALYPGQLPEIESKEEYNPWLPSASQLSHLLEEQHLPTHQQGVTQQTHYPGQMPEIESQREYNSWLQSTSKPTHLLDEQHLPTHQQGVMQQSHFSGQLRHTEPCSGEDLLLPSTSQPSSSCHTLERKEDKW